MIPLRFMLISAADFSRMVRRSGESGFDTYGVSDLISGAGGGVAGAIGAGVTIAAALGVAIGVSLTFGVSVGNGGGDGGAVACDTVGDAEGGFGSVNDDEPLLSNSLGGCLCPVDASLSLSQTVPWNHANAAIIANTTPAHVNQIVPSRE